jgi:glycosyltransferase involved in cell wall biosynthesis
MRIAILVPSFNEGSNLIRLLESLEEALSGDLQIFTILVINDGSLDDTVALFARFLNSRVKSDLAIKMINMPFNCGVGTAMRTGFMYAHENRFDYAIQVDADGQHSPESIGAILTGLNAGYDLVIGSRFLGDEKHLHQMHTSRRRSRVLKLVSRYISKSCGQQISDATSGFRGANSSLIELFSKLYPSEYLGDTLDSILLVKLKGFSIKDVPVVMKPRLSGERSQNRLRSALFLSRALLNISLFAIGRKS